MSKKTFIFQSTPSVGRATTKPDEIRAAMKISIHALRGEGDLQCSCKVNGIMNFNPRPPWGGRRILCFDCCKFNLISIHALRGEGDFVTTIVFTACCNFNPRPPWGGRLINSHTNVIPMHFNPRPPWGGRPKVNAADYDFIAISIHALRGEGDPHVVASACHR